MKPNTLMVVGVDTRRLIPKSSVTRPRMEPRFVSEQVPLSGLLALLLKRAGRMLNALPKGTGPETLSLDATPFPTSAYNYGGFLSETPASSTASVIPQRGTIPEFNLISQTTSVQNHSTSVLEFKFRRVETCLHKQRLSKTARREGWSRGVHASRSVLLGCAIRAGSWPWAGSVLCSIERIIENVIRVVGCISPDGFGNDLK